MHTHGIIISDNFGQCGTCTHMTMLSICKSGRCTSWLPYTAPYNVYTPSYGLFNCFNWPNKHIYTQAQENAQTHRHTHGHHSKPNCYVKL